MVGMAPETIYMWEHTHGMPKVPGFNPGISGGKGSQKQVMWKTITWETLGICSLDFANNFLFWSDDLSDIFLLVLLVELFYNTVSCREQGCNGEVLDRWMGILTDGASAFLQSDSYQASVRWLNSRARKLSALPSGCPQAWRWSREKLMCLLLAISLVPGSFQHFLSYLGPPLVKCVKTTSRERATQEQTGLFLKQICSGLPWSTSAGFSWRCSQAQVHWRWEQIPPPSEIRKYRTLHYSESELWPFYAQYSFFFLFTFLSGT